MRSGEPTRTLLCPVDSDQLLEELELMRWSPEGTTRYAVLCNEPLLHSDRGTWRLRNNLLSDYTQLSQMVDTINASQDGCQEKVHVTAFENTDNSTRSLDTVREQSDQTHIIVVQGKLEIRLNQDGTQHYYEVNEPEPLTGAWESWVLQLTKPPSKSSVDLQPISNKTIWIELRSAKGMQSKVCNTKGCSFRPCGFSNHKDQA
jgi:hypothetical protein